MPTALRTLPVWLGLLLVPAAASAGVTATPATLTLATPEARGQLVLTAGEGAKAADATGRAKYASTNPAVAAVTPTGRVLAKAAGSAEIVATVGAETVRVPVTVGAAADAARVNFPNQVAPVLTKLGCNAGGCHGKASGQAGFRISLLGFDPEFDYMTLVKEGRGRRLFPAAPDESLFLKKATGSVPHGGGKKLDAASDEYALLKRWIAAGMPFGEPTDPTLARVTVFPTHRVLAPGSTQQFAVTAHYSDGSSEDVTARAQYETNDAEIAALEGDGLVRTLARNGEAAVMARYQGQVAVFRASVPLTLKPGQTMPAWTFPEQTFVDPFTSAKWRELGLMPSPLASDEVFLRRVTLDLTGTVPTPEQVRAFLADTSKTKRDAAIDRLLDSPEYADFFANKWADVLRVKRRDENERAAGTFAFHAWIRDAIRADTPYDEFARSVLTATGHESKNPAVVWFKEVAKPEQFVDDVGQVFLGQRLACAQCHHHPYEKWSQDDYWGLAAFYARVGRKEITLAGQDPQRGRLRTEAIYTKAAGSVTNKQRNRPAVAKPLDGEPATLSPGDDPREALAAWMTAPDNPFFARAVANRYWAHFFGRGIVDPLDDMRVTNPPSNPELLDALAKSLVGHKFSLKAFTRELVRSRTYQLAAEPNEFNTSDRQTFARYYPKRLSAEVLLDVLNQVTGTRGEFNGVPRDKNAPSRAVQLPDESFSNYFLEVFGKPKRISACECERINETSLAQVLHLLNSDEVQSKLGRTAGRADLLTRTGDARTDAEKVEELFLATLGRKPSEKDLAAALDHLGKNAKAKRAAYENLMWALVNTKEFLFNQ